MPELTEQEIIDTILYARSIEYAYQLESWTTEALKPLIKSLRQAQKEILSYLDASGVNLSDWSETRSIALLDNFHNLTVGARTALGDSITQIATAVGANALIMHSDILSFGGRVEPFNNVSMAPAQLKSFVVDTPLGGKVMQEWVDSVYDFNIQQQIKSELFTGALKGEDYSELVGRIRTGFGIAEKDAIDLARGYIQSANVGAQEIVAEQNKDVVRGLKWTAALETSFKKSGRGTCIRCAVLDGTKYAMDEEHPMMPLHFRCRCIWTYLLISWKELGLDIPEVEEAYRPWVSRPNINIGTGRKGKILDSGFIQGSYSDFMASQSDRFQKNVLGPKRFELYNSGKVKFEDMVDSTTGRLKLLKEIS